MTQQDHEHGECRKLLKDLSSYIDGDLDAALCQEIQQHMVECDKCRVVVDTLRKTVLLYHDLPPEPMPEDIEERLFKRLKLTQYVSAS